LTDEESNDGASLRGICSSRLRGDIWRSAVHAVAETKREPSGSFEIRRAGTPAAPSLDGSLMHQLRITFLV